MLNEAEPAEQNGVWMIPPAFIPPSRTFTRNRMTARSGSSTVLFKLMCLLGLSLAMGICPLREVQAHPRLSDKVHRCELRIPGEAPCTRQW